MRDLCDPYRAVAWAVVRLVIAEVDREAVGRLVRLSPSLEASPALFVDEGAGLGAVLEVDEAPCPAD